MPKVTALPWRLLPALLLPLLAIWALQTWERRPQAGTAPQLLRSAKALASESALPPPQLTSAPPQSLPLRRARGAPLWLEFELPPPQPESQQLLLAFRPAMQVFLDGELLARSDAPNAAEAEGLVLGHRRLAIDLPPALHRHAGQRLQLRLAAPGPSGASLDAPLLGPPEVLRAQDSRRQRWQALRGLTAGAGVLAALFLGLVAWVRRSEPIYALAAAHVALLALLLSPYLLTEQWLPSPWWRVLLDSADLCAKALLLTLSARLARAWTPRLRRALLVFLLLCLLIDGWAAVSLQSWSDFSRPWPWWALGSRALLLLLAWCLALRALQRRQDVAAWGTALLVGFSASTWAWVSLSALVLQRPEVDSNALAYAGWVLWVMLMLQRHFIDAARRDADLQRRLAAELEQRSEALQQAFEAKAEAERLQASAEQRRRLLQDLHDGLGSRLLQLRLSAGGLDAAQLQLAVDECLLEMRLSVDSLVETEGDIGVLLGGWRQRIEAMLRAADVEMDWRVQASAAVPCLRGAGALELVRWLQEALSNALRHGQPTRLIVATQWADGDGAEVDERQASSLVLWFIDDGHGLPEQLRAGQGLRNLEARAKRLGAAMSLLSPVPVGWLETGKGTALGLRLALR